MILVINKLDSRFTVVQFRTNHLDDYRLNRTPLTPITIIYNNISHIGMCHSKGYNFQAFLVRKRV